MKIFLPLLLALFTCYPAIAQQTVFRVYSTIEFAGPDAQNSKSLTFNSQNWVWPGDVLSTSVKSLPLSLGSFASVADAKLVVVWTPQPGAVARLVSADTGPSNIQNVGEWAYPAVTGSPTVTAVNVTEGFQNVLDGGIWKQIGLQLSGSGVLNRATLEIVWEIDLTNFHDRLTALESATQTSPSTSDLTIEVPPEGISLEFLPE